MACIYGIASAIYYIHVAIGKEKSHSYFPYTQQWKKAAGLVELLLN
jgi:hypothetical protein